MKILQIDRVGSVRPPCRFGNRGQRAGCAAVDQIARIVDDRTHQFRVNTAEGTRDEPPRCARRVNLLDDRACRAIARTAPPIGRALAAAVVDGIRSPRSTRRYVDIGLRGPGFVARGHDANVVAVCRQGVRALQHPRAGRGVAGSHDGHTRAPRSVHAAYIVM